MLKCPLDDVCTSLSRKVQVKVKVVDRDKTQAEDLLGFDEVTEISAGEVAAGVAFAAQLDGGGVFGEGGVFKVEGACGGKCGAVASKAGGKHAIKHVHSTRNHFDDLRRGAESHCVPWAVLREEGNGIFDGAEHFVFGFPHTDASDGVAIKADLYECAGAFLSQIGVRGALDDAKKEGPIFLRLCIPPSTAPMGPANGKIEALGGILVAAWMRGALVEKHDNIGTEVALDFH